MKPKIMTVKITFFEEILGTAAGDPKIHSEFISGKAPDAKSMEEEIATIGVEEVEQKQKTIFSKEDGKPLLWDYQIKGFMKGTCGFMRRIPNTLSGKLKAYMKVIDGTIYVTPRKIFFDYNGHIGDCQRPLLARTPQGERVALANSETVAPGASLTFSIHMFDPGHEALVREWLDFGVWTGIGQWRNSGKGRFSWEEITPKQSKAKAEHSAEVKREGAAEKSTTAQS